MAVKLTQALRDALISEGADEDKFVDAFERWKYDWPAREYDSELFGKDGAYSRPKVDGQHYKLRHVHLKPVTDEAQLERWLIFFKRRSRKTSNRVLVYTYDQRRRDYLLIFILPEPDAHAVAEMRTNAMREIMEGFAETAAAFLINGEIIA